MLTNDDGYNEPGLVELARHVKPMGEMIVVAPKHPQSITGHRVTVKCQDIGERPRTKGLDVDVCLSGKIAVSRLKI